MKIVNIVNIRLIIFVLLLGIGQSSVYAKKLRQDRIYEPIVLRGEILSHFYDVPIPEIYMHAFHESTKTWIMMPFQIDEMEFGDDPFKPGNEGARQDFYFLQDDGLLDFRDELIFMVRDLGDKAPDHAWIDNEESRSYQRLEILVCDPNDTENRSYGYLFRSSTITEPVPSPYGFNFDPINQIMENKYYSVRLSTLNGLIEDVIIKPPSGLGIDIFDTQKLRFIGVFDLGIITIGIGKNGSPAANERDNLYVYNENDINDYHLWYTPRPSVRLIREVRQTIRFGTFVMNQTAFYVKTKFYPFSGTISGGAELDPETLKKEFQTEEEIYVRLDLLRQSWDFNAAAKGMKFYSRHNQNIVIDGFTDVVNKTIETPIKEWALSSGDQGSMFTHVEFNDTSWQKVQLYYYDDKHGGQGDETYIDGGDTGDSVSYGDQGILFQNLANDSVSLKLNFIAYFLPANLSPTDGNKLAYWVENPVICKSNAISFPTDVNKKDNPIAPDQFDLYQNYPNPFNTSTKITFTVPRTEYVILEVIDMTGKIVTTLVDGKIVAGTHAIIWNGIDNYQMVVPSGIYFYALSAENYSKAKKLILLR